MTTLLAENLRRARKTAGLSQEECAFRAGIHPNNISAYERGVATPRVRTLLKLAEVLGVQAVDLRGPVEREPPQSLAEHFGERVRFQRRRVGLSQERLARSAGVCLDTVHRIEKGNRSPTLRTVVRLADVLGIDPAVLVTGLRP
jgi:transcriptional regulator with XRE-family HTH domain